MKSTRMIGLAKQVGGLYLLKAKTQEKMAEVQVSNITTESIPESSLWHFRLGHLSHERLETMSRENPIIFINKYAVCDICHLAKKKKLPYLMSKNRASKICELLHFDIWVPIK
uniref:GAG-pre-integrase domain-containing protein n=1 Tax=Cajanus cajan TaxID=3821 RepID=A0A151UGW8_CAJCA